jgi:imidazolonepropionase-like amidohydrolase
MGLDCKVGTLEAAKQADFLVLDANPTDDVANIRTVRLAMAGGGRLYESAARWGPGFGP